ncbi:MAG: M15 family metallopeptidase [Patescibacteria group bacterium]|nr:M15 family metallopeptidase [Patescibacteria group bacterium]
MIQLKKLEKRMVAYQQLTNIKSIDNNESLVTLEPKFGALEARYSKLQDMIPLTGEKILVRETVKQKLVKVSQNINKINKRWKLLVMYGYRAPKIQKRYFVKNLTDMLEKQKEVPSPVNLYEMTHRQVAVPKVSGHPTGGAVDVSLINTNGNLVNCGSKIYDLKNIKRYTFMTLKNKSAKKARFILRDVMMQENFAPFDGEWWHFSYGDKEWAAYYKKQTAFYNQLSLKVITNLQGLSLKSKKQAKLPQETSRFNPAG